MLNRKTVTVYNAKAHFSELIRTVVETKQSVTITNNKKPVVDIIVHQKTAKNPLLQNPILKGALYKGNPFESVDLQDWPEDLR